MNKYLIVGTLLLSGMILSCKKTIEKELKGLGDNPIL